MSKIPNLSPCVLHFRNVEVSFRRSPFFSLPPALISNSVSQSLCRDESGNEDDRTMDYFIKQIKSNASSFPVIVFCTSSLKTEISPALQRIFLQTVHISSPNFDSRCSLFSWILRRMRIEPADINIEEIARATPNFVYADFVQLICRALQ